MQVHTRERMEFKLSSWAMTRHKLDIVEWNHKNMYLEKGRDFLPILHRWIHTSWIVCTSMQEENWTIWCILQMIQQSVLAHETTQSTIFALQIGLKTELRIIFGIAGNKYFQAASKQFTKPVHTIKWFCLIWEDAKMLPNTKLWTWFSPWYLPSDHWSQGPWWLGHSNGMCVEEPGHPSRCCDDCSHPQVAI